MKNQWASKRVIILFALTGPFLHDSSIIKLLEETFSHSNLYFGH